MMLLLPKVLRVLSHRGNSIFCVKLKRSLLRCLQCQNSQKLFYSQNPKEAKDDSIPLENIRNFCIIAHVDHGKSTLADRFLEITGVITQSNENKQVLDRLKVEKERGITVKAVTASLCYNHNNTDYLLNLIDTPGHVDFSNEVSRSLFACQGVILLIDANQGVQAQTVSTFYSAFVRDLIIIPVLNKIDLPNADPDRVEKELISLFDFEKSSIHRISAKTGQGVEDLLKTVIEKVPPPNVSRDAPFRALLIDSWFDKYRGVILFIYVGSGKVYSGDEIMGYQSKKKYTVKSIGKLVPEEEPVKVLEAGQVGVIGCNMKAIKDAHIGDTLHDAKASVEPLQSFEPAKPMVYAGVFPRDQSVYENMKAAIEKLCLNDPSVTVAIETSPALGLGWRLGFLGLLHLDVFRQRLEQEHQADSVVTAPNVTYRVKIKSSKNDKKSKNEIIDIKNPVEFPDSNLIEECYEPVVLATIITPVKHMQEIIDECLRRRAEHEDSKPLDKERIMLTFVIPLNEIIFDFHDKLKSLSSGYASFDYQDHGYVMVPLEKVSILLNGREVEELAMVVPTQRARERAKELVEKLEQTIPRQMVLVTIQAKVGGTITASRKIKPYRKDVTQKLYGGDVTRKMKLLKYQKEGKQKMREFANIQIPKDTFVDVLKK